MQIITPFRRTDLHAHAQSLRLWVLEILAWMAAAVGFRQGRIAVRALQSEVRRDLRELVFAMMCARMAFRKREGALPTAIPRSAPPGFRFAWRRFNVDRFYTRGVAMKTFRQMQAVLNDLDRVVTRAIARVPKRRAPGAIVAVAPPRAMLVQYTFARAPEGADTS
ncbi:MAG: hypothetical protein FD160_2997 [Caulobacteraceae bacterium]|nr:MAG: hypothetical protein FD160_2997 [Caulobacteraceae bacterium]